MLKTRYLQLSDIMMLEYSMLGENGTSEHNINDLYVIKTMDGHLSTFNPCSYEVESTDDGYKKQFNPKTLNTLNHLAIPKDAEGSMWYMFLDSNYEFCNERNFNTFTSADFAPEEFNDDFSKSSEYADIKVMQYYNNLDYVDPITKFKYFTGITNLRFDTIKIYFVNGYDFSNIYGMFARMTLNLANNVDGNEFLDLCNFVVTKNNAYMLMKYLTSPIIFGNNIYDRYIEINVPCVYDLVKNRQDKDHHELYDLLNIVSDQSIKMQFGYIMDDDVTVETIQYDPVQIALHQTISTPVNCTFSFDSVLKGSIPTKSINSDNIGVYIAESPDLPYIEFYGTWNDMPLTKDIVSQFNKNIMLYNNSMVRRENAYEVDNDYQVGYDMRQWVAMHELKCSFCKEDIVLKEETYSMSQIFVSDNDEVKFKYRPLIFDERLGMDVDYIQVIYTMRFVNVNDKVQFMKVGSLVVTPQNISKYYAKGTSLGFSDTRPFRVYNKIIESSSVPVKHTEGSRQLTKYVKVYYDSSNITLYDGSNNYTPYTYTLNMSQVPKVYKFVFRNATVDGKYSNIDLSNGSYKLAFKDASGNDYVIEPTYSNNMNLYLGELEFEFTNVHINKLMNISENDAKMSIVSCGDNGYVTSMYDFMFKI